MKLLDNCKEVEAVVYLLLCTPQLLFVHPNQLYNFITVVNKGLQLGYFKTWNVRHLVLCLHSLGVLWRHQRGGARIMTSQWFIIVYHDWSCQERRSTTWYRPGSIYWPWYRGGVAWPRQFHTHPPGWGAIRLQLILARMPRPLAAEWLMHNTGKEGILQYFFRSILFEIYIVLSKTWIPKIGWKKLGHRDEYLL